MSVTATPKAIMATFKEGKIVLPPGVDWPDGTVVCIEPVKQETPASLRELLKDFEGVANDLPSDMAANHDHYIHGGPKK